MGTEDFIKNFQERRRYTRVSISTVTRYYCPWRDEEVGVQTKISDISEGGALLVTFNEGIPLDTEVQMSFSLPSAEQNAVIDILGKVRHTGFLAEEQFRSGVEFIKLQKKDQQKIRDFVASKKSNREEDVP